ncbi:hypothetical protein A3Q56_01411 [Intoshia linei]|uniref:Uncharacterized protein n=1 Tax=Intoshia linei TaxID=1819745 RepID=A0A177B980_9BILA|nr:hypothetical protein A3Q56_01411 [Intoshia linei]
MMKIKGGKITSIFNNKAKSVSENVKINVIPSNESKTSYSLRDINETVSNSDVDSFHNLPLNLPEDKPNIFHFFQSKNNFFNIKNTKVKLCLPIFFLLVQTVIGAFLIVHSAMHIQNMFKDSQLLFFTVYMSLIPHLLIYPFYRIIVSIVVTFIGVSIINYTPFINTSKDQYKTFLKLWSAISISFFSFFAALSKILMHKIFHPINVGISSFAISFSAFLGLLCLWPIILILHYSHIEYFITFNTIPWKDVSIFCIYSFGITIIFVFGDFISYDSLTKLTFNLALIILIVMFSKKNQIKSTEITAIFMVFLGAFLEYLPDNIISNLSRNNKIESKVLS